MLIEEFMSGAEVYELGMLAGLLILLAIGIWHTNKNTYYNWLLFLMWLSYSCTVGIAIGTAMRVFTVDNTLAVIGENLLINGW